MQVQEPMQQHSQKLQIVLNIPGELRRYTYSVGRLFEQLLVLEQCPNTKLVVNVTSQGANLQQLINGLSAALMKAGLIFKQVPFAVQCTIYQQTCFLDPTVEEVGPSMTRVFVR